MKLLVDMNLSPPWIGLLTDAGIEDVHWSSLGPAEAAGLVKSAMTVGDIIDLIDARAGVPKKRGPYKPRQPKVVM